MSKHLFLINRSPAGNFPIPLHHLAQHARRITPLRQSEGEEEPLGVGREDEALQSLRRALYLDDSLALGHFWLGNLYRERGDVARACQEYENVVRDWERHTLQLTEEFASDLTAEQLVGFCSDTLERLQMVSDGES